MSSYSMEMILITDGVIEIGSITLSKIGKYSSILNRKKTHLYQRSSIFSDFLLSAGLYYQKIGRRGREKIHGHSIV